MKYRIGTRDSKLALKQTEIVCKKLLEMNSNLSSNQFEIIPIKTQGDKILHKNLIDFGGKNLFIKEIEEALERDVIDFAVHSLKDMTGSLDKQFVIAAYLEREDPRDAFVSLEYKSLYDLPKNAVIGTSSIRRKYITLSKRRDLSIVPFRGNVLTRIDKLKQNQALATFLAVAGLNRLAIDPGLYLPLSVEEYLPAVCQGIIGVECRKQDQRIRELLSTINNETSEICAKAERGFLEELNADCTSPIAAYAELKDNQIYLDALVINQEEKITRKSFKANREHSIELGIEAAKSLKNFL